MSEGNTTAEIIIQGLIALAPFFGVPADGEINYMTALVVDSERFPVEDRCRVVHKPMIRFRTKENICTADFFGDCKANFDVCTCPLDRHEVILDSVPLPPIENTTTQLPPDLIPPVPLPDNNTKEIAGDISYVANLFNLGFELDAVHLSAPLPQTLMARFRFPFDELLACEHSFFEDRMGIATVHPADFRPAGTPPLDSQLEHAAAQTLIVSFNVETETLPITLVLKQYADNGNEGPVSDDEKRFELLSNDLRIELMNHRPEEMDLEDPCGVDIGRDFAVFYDLVKEPIPIWEDRQIPHLNRMIGKLRRDVVPEKCDQFKNPNSRPICPLVIIP